MSQESSLRSAWLGTADGRLCVREQAKAWALREVWQDEGKPAYGMFTWIASRVKTTLNGKPVGPSPDRTSTRRGDPAFTGSVCPLGRLGRSVGH